MVEPTPLKNDGVRQLRDDYAIYEMEKWKIHVPNHQPVILYASLDGEDSYLGVQFH